ncbi:hypothetical protein RZS08_40880, partial [Arthrospira platensis SPKY1]|nr:hypothetical protein [Arthrospira platensis SPKY1]
AEAIADVVDVSFADGGVNTEVNGGIIHRVDLDIAAVPGTEAAEAASNLGEAVVMHRTRCVVAGCVLGDADAPELLDGHMIA